MTIAYCDYITGNDTTGDGTYTLPYKTIDKASTGLTGGDEVRVAASPAAVDISGTATLTFTLNSTTVTASANIFVDAVTANENDTSVRLGDFIKGADGNWWEVITWVSNTQATLYQRYSGGTTSGVNSYKLRVTSTGAAASSSTVVQRSLVSGTSAANMLKISGGWTLATQTQDGQTYFRQLHGTFATRNGSGFQLDKNYIEIERLHFFRYYLGLYLYIVDSNTITSPICNSSGKQGIYLASSCFNNTITSPTCNSNGDMGLYLSGASKNTITSPTCSSNAFYGIWIVGGSNNNTVTSPICYSNTYYGISLSNGNNNTITSPICNNNDRGIYLTSSGFNTIITPACNGNSISGIYFTSWANSNTIISPICNNNILYGIYIASNCRSNTVIKYSGTGNGTQDIYVFPSTVDYHEFPLCSFQRYQLTSGENRSYFNYGITYRDTANARSGECLKYECTSASLYSSHSFFFATESGYDSTLTAYIKKSATFDGDVQGSIYFLGEKITGWTAITPTANDTYEQKSLVASAANIIEAGVLELRIKVRGTAGNVYVDDLGVSY